MFVADALMVDGQVDACHVCSRQESHLAMCTLKGRGLQAAADIPCKHNKVGRVSHVWVIMQEELSAAYEAVHSAQEETRQSEAQVEAATQRSMSSASTEVSKLTVVLSVVCNMGDSKWDCAFGPSPFTASTP